MKGLLMQDNDLVRINGRLVEISGRDYYLQRIKNAIRTILKEIKYNESLGIDWFALFQAKTTEDRFLREISRVILLDPETESISELVIQEIDRVRRKLKLSVKLKSTYGIIPLTEAVTI